MTKSGRGDIIAYAPILYNPMVEYQKRFGIFMYNVLKHFTGSM